MHSACFKHFDCLKAFEQPVRMLYINPFFSWCTSLIRFRRPDEWIFQLRFHIKIMEKTLSQSTWEIGMASPNWLNKFWPSNCCVYHLNFADDRKERNRYCQRELFLTGIMYLKVITCYKAAFFLRYNPYLYSFLKVSNFYVNFFKLKCTFGHS